MDAFSPLATAGWPPGLSRTAYRHCPVSIRDDAVQTAWLAVAEGRKPDSAVRALLRHEQRHTARKPNFDLCPVGEVRKRF